MQPRLLPEHDSTTLLGDSPRLADAAHGDGPQDQNGNETSDSHRHLNRVRPYDSLQTSLWVFKERLFAHNEGISVTHSATCTESNGTVRSDSVKRKSERRGKGRYTRDCVETLRRGRRYDIQNSLSILNLLSVGIIITIYHLPIICQHYVLNFLFINLLFIVSVI